MTTTKKQMWEDCYRSDRLAVRNILKDYEDDWDIVDELTQETFLRAWECIEEYDEGSTFLTWVCGIAKNVGGHHLEHVTAEKRKGEVLASHMEPAYHDDEVYGQELIHYYDRVDQSQDLLEQCWNLDPARTIEAEQSVEYAYASLPGAARHPMRLRAEGYSNLEIAEMLDLSEAYVRKLISRARKFLPDGNNREGNRTNSVYSERDERPVERFASQEDVERAARERFRRRDSAFRKRQVRLAHPDASTAEWRELYE